MLDYTRERVFYVSIKTSPPDPNKYTVGEIYVEEVGTHLLVLKCIAKDEHGLFHFEELADLRQ
ncbi:MAG: hypothetical protein A2Z04_06680 [Chloroflexi bacterium RBG_16_57_9]|nr:MAG: hypothetical protein A2Z04_06680 [Chloroflexi bacterium RBG_16_57_9]